MDPDPDLILANQCGFQTFDDIVKRMNEIVEIMKTGRNKVESNLEIYKILAKEYLELKEKNKAKSQLLFKKKLEYKIKIYDEQFKDILEKVEVAETIYEMIDILSTIKSVNNELIKDLDKNETGEETENVKEFQDLMEIDKEINNYIDIITKFNKESEQEKSNIPPKELNLLKKCGFNNFDEAIKKINELMNVMQAGRLIVKKSFQRFVFEAKRFIKKGEMEAARNQLKLEIKEEEIITKYDLKYLSALRKLEELENTEELLKILTEAKECNKILLEELNDKEIQKATMKLKEYQDLIENEIKIDNYIDIINSFKKLNID